ncbi:MAG: anti-sigma factor family protein [Opitutales bacterium]
MTDDRFRELVNLYLDKEISAGERSQLKTELASSESRRAEFEELRRLHRAMMLALGSSLDASGPRGEAPQVVRLRRWMTGIGAAACVLAGASLALSWPMLDESDEVMVGQGGALGDPFDGASMAPSDIRRYHASRRDEAIAGTSLAAHLRLLGLSPGVVSAETELTSVDPAELRAGDDRQSTAELFERMQDASPIPQPELVEFPEQVPADSTSRWSGGFQTSLASFQ